MALTKADRRIFLEIIELAERIVAWALFLVSELNWIEGNEVESSLPGHSVLSIKKYLLYLCSGNFRVNFEVDDFWTIAMLERRIEELAPRDVLRFAFSNSSENSGRVEATRWVQQKLLFGPLFIARLIWA